MAVALVAAACVIAHPVDAKPGQGNGKGPPAPHPGKGAPGHGAAKSKGGGKGAKSPGPKGKAGGRRGGAPAGQAKKGSRRKSSGQGSRPPRRFVGTARQTASTPRRTRQASRRAARTRQATRRAARRPRVRPIRRRHAVGAVAASRAASTANPAQSPASGATHRPGADTPNRATPSKSSGPVRAVTKVIERVPGWLWILLAGISGLCVVAFAVSIVAGLRARRAQRQRRLVMEDIGLLQAALLPPVRSRLGGLQLSAAYRPAEGPAAGGDFYDAFPLRDGRVGLVIGDVSGHGRGALAQTALVRFTVRAYLEAGLEPRDALKLSQSTLEDKLGDEFVTVMLAAYDPESAILTYAGAGHAPPLLRGTAHAPAVTAASAPLIGAGIGTGLRQTTVSLSGGTTVCLYTDGIVEAMVDDRLLGRNKLAGILDVLGKDATAAKLLDQVIETADRANDDMAVCLAYVPFGVGAEATPHLVEELEVSRRDITQRVPERFLEACGISRLESGEALRNARTLVDEFDGALLRVYRHEHPQRVEVGAVGVPASFAASLPARG